LRLDTCGPRRKQTDRLPSAAACEESVNMQRQVSCCIYIFDILIWEDAVSQQKEGFHATHAGTSSGSSGQAHSPIAVKWLIVRPLSGGISRPAVRGRGRVRLFLLPAAGPSQWWRLFASGMSLGVRWKFCAVAMHHQAEAPSQPHRSRMDSS